MKALHLIGSGTDIQHHQLTEKVEVVCVVSCEKYWFSLLISAFNENFVSNKTGNCSRCPVSGCDFAKKKKMCTFKTINKFSFHRCTIDLVDVNVLCVEMVFLLILGAIFFLWSWIANHTVIDFLPIIFSDILGIGPLCYYLLQFYCVRANIMIALESSGIS